MQVSLEEADANLVLELLARLKTGVTVDDPAITTGAAAQSKPREADARAKWREERAVEALAAEKVARRKDKERAAVLKEAFAADLASSRAAPPTGAGSDLPMTGSVRVTLCAADKPSNLKPVVLQRSDDLAELLKTGKAKLRLKKAAGARLLDGDVWIRSTAQLRDGDVVSITAAEAPPLQVEADPLSSAQAVRMDDTEGGSAQAAAGATDPPSCATDAAAAQHPPAERRIKRPTSLPQRLSGAAAASEQERLASHSAPPAMLAARASLPTASRAEDLLGAIGSSRATIVVGEPGCGKSTQLPQMILEQMVAQGRGGEAAIVVAQPRRVSALSLAARVKTCII